MRLWGNAGGEVGTLPTEHGVSLLSSVVLFDEQDGTTRGVFSSNRAMWTSLRSEDGNEIHSIADDGYTVGGATTRRLFTGACLYVVDEADTVGWKPVTNTGNGALPVVLTAGVVIDSAVLAVVGGTTAAAIAAGAGATQIKANPGRVCRALVTATGTGSGFVTIYDHASAAGGTVVALIPANAAVGTLIDLGDMPVNLGIRVVNVADGPALTLGYR